MTVCELHEELEKLQDLLLGVAVRQDSDPCNGCQRKYGWHRQRYHCAYCGECLATMAWENHDECELAEALK